MSYYSCLALALHETTREKADVNERPNSACSSPSSPSFPTVYVTVPASPTTETIYAVSEGASAIEGGLSATATTVTVTVTTFSTPAISVIHAASPTAPYSFTEDNGTTIWLGGNTPPASASLVTSTSFITLHPVVSPWNSGVSEGRSAQATTYLTLSSTRTITETFTETLTHSLTTGLASAKGYTGFGSAGWNATFSEAKATATRSGLVNVEEKAAGKGLALRTSYGNSTNHVEPRQIIVATIDDVAVSWTNSYDGSNPITISPFSSPVQVSSSSAAVATTTVAIYPWDLNPARISTSAAAQTTTVAIYPWDLDPAPGSSALSILPASISPSRTQSMTPAVHSPSPISFHHTLLTRTSAPLVSFSTYSNTSRAVSPTATNAPSSCGNASAFFTIDFDDLPAFSTGPGDADIPPIFNPYRKLFFEEHFGYVPPPTDPFPPHSPPQLAVYRENGLNVSGSIDAGLGLLGEIGAGPRADDAAYWIDVFSAWLGCADGGPDDCIMTVNGYTHGENVGNVTQVITQPPCLGLKNCSLALVEFDQGFRDLTGLQIIATVKGKSTDWYMDDLKLGWSISTCAAQLQRSSSE